MDGLPLPYPKRNYTMRNKVFLHLIEQPFVFATGVAALVHSTWSLGTLFSGTQPPAGLNIDYIGWLAPALLISFALDVGQIATSTEIRTHGLTWARGITFVVFAVATYYLQWLYIAHHMPALELAPGVRESWGSIATLIRDSALWFIPSLLPLSTLLYTFSNKLQESPTQTPVTITTEQPTAHTLPALERTPAPMLTEPTPSESDTEQVEAVKSKRPTPARRSGKLAQKLAELENMPLMPNVSAPTESATE